MGRSLGISYSVGFYGFSLWLVGATVVVFAAAIGYAMWVGRDRPMRTTRSMLFLLGAVVATFAAQDLLLFYVSFEAMLIPLYVLVGVWGGERRLAATFTFVVYTMARLAADARVRRRLRRDAGGRSRSPSRGPATTCGSSSGSRSRSRSRHRSSLHGWLPLAYREAPVEVAAVLSAIVSKTAIYGFIRIGIPKFPSRQTTSPG